MSPLLLNPNCQRIFHPEILPLEVADLLVDGRAIYDRMRESGLAPVLQHAISVLFEGRGATVSNGALPSEVAGFDAVFLGGGRALETGLKFVEPACDVFFSPEGVFAAMSGGFALLGDRGLSGWVVDLGQSHLKVDTGTRRIVIKRDVQRLRGAGSVSLAQIPSQRRRLCEFIALNLRMLLAESESAPRGLVLALPARLQSDGTPEASNYAGLCGYHDLVRDVLACAGVDHVTVLLLNDAELAALSARIDPRLREYRKILVLTLGFGLGAAVVCRSS